MLGCDFVNFYNFRSCVAIHRVVTSRKPNYLFEKLLPFRNTRTRNYLIPSHSSVYYSQSFFARGVVNWNSIPTTLKNIYSKYTFKRYLLANFNMNH